MANKRHVIPKKGGGWQVRKPDGKSGSSHATQREAIDHARQIVRKSGGGEIIVHGSDGRIRDSDTVFGRDPNPPRSSEDKDTVPRKEEKKPASPRKPGDETADSSQEFAGENRARPRKS